MRLKRKMRFVFISFLFVFNQGFCNESVAEGLQLDSTLSQEQQQELLDMQMPALLDDSGKNQSAIHDHASVSQVINNTSLNNLSAHAWKVVGIRGAKDLHFKLDGSVYLFSKDLKFKAFLGCNYINGKYEANDGGKFLLRDLNSSNKSCNDSRDQEVLIESILLAVDKYFIDNKTLYLGTKGEPVLAFNETSQSISATESKRPVKAKMERKSIEKAKVVKGSVKVKVASKAIINRHPMVKNKNHRVVKSNSLDKPKPKKKNK